MRTTCFNHDWLLSGISKIAAVTAVLPSISSSFCDTCRRGNAHHHMGIDEGIPQRIKLSKMFGKASCIKDN
jgi:hypothetical protein